jgi:hypothetical protein
MVAGSGPGQAVSVRVFSGANGTNLSQGSPYPGFGAGLFVAGTVLNDPFGSPLRASVAGGNGAGTETLDLESRNLVGAAGLLRRTTLEKGIADLPGDLLGLARPGRILIDVDAAGHGWFVDGTPEDDAEFVPGEGGLVAENGRAAAGIDLVTVLWHEFGHLLGLDDLDHGAPIDDVMSSRLSPGVRRTHLAAVDAVFGA